MAVVLGGIAGAAIGAAGSIYSGRQSARFAQDSYKQRYQWQVKDLKKAGLNPMLAYSQGAPNVPQAEFENIGEGAMKGFSAAQQVRLVKQQYNNAVATEQDTMQSARGKKLANDILEATPEYQDAAKTVLDTGAIGRGATAAKRVELDFQERQARINNLAEQTVGHKLSNQQLEKIQPVLLKIEKLRAKGMSADLIEKEVNAEWFEALGATDKYGPALKMLLMFIQRALK